MNIDIILTAGEVSTHKVQHKTVAVIDVFRATSVIATALYHGAKRVIPVTTIAEAFAMKEALTDKGVIPIIGGERNAIMVDGFNKGNSPYSYTGHDIVGQTIVLTTTNGTRAINNSRAASHIFIASFINLTAVCEAMINRGKNIVLVCSGREDNFTLEDFMCAGAMVEYISSKVQPCYLSDISRVAMSHYVSHKDNLKETLKDTTHYNFMMSLSLEPDIDDCLKIDTIKVAPYLDDGYNIIL